VLRLVAWLGGPLLAWLAGLAALLARPLLGLRLLALLAMPLLTLAHRIPPELGLASLRPPNASTIWPV
jgi:hypothetical protein